VLDEHGRSNFARLAHGRTGSHYYAFDFFMLGNDNLRVLPLSERKPILETLVSGCDPVRYTDHVVGTGTEFFELVKQAGLEGMVAKRGLSKIFGRAQRRLA
jgi:bifunctional non-homologous end joining protein LigD